MADRKLAGWAASSQTPDQVSARIKGIILALSSVIIFLAAQLFGIQLSANDIVALSTEIGMIAGAVWTIYGGGVALVSWFATIRN